MTIEDDLRMAIDPVYFAREGLGFFPDSTQGKVLRSDSKRLILNCHRQWGKSVIAAIKGLHRAIFYEKSLILLISPSLRQSSELQRKVNDFSRDYKNMPVKVEDSKTFMTLENGSRIISLPAREGTVRGYSGVNLIIADESAQILDELYYSIRPMMAVSGGSLILLSTPRGKRGFYHKTWVEGDKKTWQRIMVKASQCKRISKKFLEEEYEALGRWWFAQEYECTFCESEGQLFSYEDLKAMHSNNIKPYFSNTAITSDIKPFMKE